MQKNSKTELEKKQLKLHFLLKSLCKKRQF